MHFLRIKKLIDKMAKDEITQKEIMKCSIFVFVLQYFYILFYMDFKPTLKIVFINFVCYTLTTIIGIYLSYRKNKQGDNKNFVERFICLSVPIGIRIIFLYFTILLSVDFLSEVLKQEIYSYFFEGKTFHYSLIVMMHVLFYLCIIKRIEEINDISIKKIQIELT